MEGRRNTFAAPLAVQQQPGRVRLSWADRALMAALLALIPWARHMRLAGLVTPGTILR
jgi:hypothetical protein